MFRYNPAANYQPNGGRYLKNYYLAKIFIVVSSKDTFPARFPNIFVNYPLGQMRVGDKLWMHWNKAPMRLWHANPVEFHGVVRIERLWGQFCAPELYCPSNDWSCLLFSRVLSSEMSSKKVTDSIATLPQF